MPGSADGISLTIDQFAGAFLGIAPDRNGSVETKEGGTSFETVLEQVQTVSEDSVQKVEAQVELPPQIRAGSLPEFVESQDDSSEIPAVDKSALAVCSAKTTCCEHVREPEGDEGKETEEAALERGLVAPTLPIPFRTIADPDPEPPVNNTKLLDVERSAASQAAGVDRPATGSPPGTWASDETGSTERSSGLDGSSPGAGGNPTDSIQAALGFSPMEDDHRDVPLATPARDSVAASSGSADEIAPAVDQNASGTEKLMSPELDPVVVVRYEPAHTTSGYRIWPPLFSNTGTELRASGNRISEPGQPPSDVSAQPSTPTLVFEAPAPVRPIRSVAQSFTVVNGEVENAPKPLDAREPVKGNRDESRTEHNPASPKFVQTPPDREVSTYAESAPPQKMPPRESYDRMQQASPSLPTAADQRVLTIAQPAKSAAPRLPEMVIQIAERIQGQLQNGGTELRIQLKPEALGRMEIHAETGTHGVIARIVTESSGVKNYLESNLQILQQSLQDLGLKIDRIDFIVQDALEGRMWGGQQQAGNPGAGQNGGDVRGQDRASAVAPFASQSEILVDPVTIAALGPNSTFHTFA